MGVNLVVINGQTKLDLTSDTVTADTLQKGKIAHNASGDLITGELEGASGVSREDNTSGGETITVTSDGSSGGGEWESEMTALIQRGSPTKLPAGLKVIGEYAFYGCSSLALTSLPDGVTSIGAGGFNSCSQLALTSLPDGVTSIGSWAFYNCSQLALTSLPDGITSIGTKAFSGCSSLALTSLPDGITSIDTETFSGCSSLALTSLPDGLTYIGYQAFRNCLKITAMVIPASVTTIGYGAFIFCYGLKTVTFKGTPTDINAPFSGCSKVTDIYVPWAEGAVANAPWGATNATIHYDSEV